MVTSFLLSTSSITLQKVEPYVFPGQCTQVFFATDDLHPLGSESKVVLRKEARLHRKVEEDDDIFISTNIKDSGHVASSTFRTHPPEPDLTKAIMLNAVENAMALQGFERLGKCKRSLTTSRQKTTSARTKRSRRE